MIPPLVAYILWDRRERLAALFPRPTNIGLVVILGSVAVLFAGSLGAELFLTRISLVGMLIGLVLFFGGWKWLGGVLFPLAVLLLMIPIPQVIFNQVAFPMQLAASQLASMSLETVGVPVLREGNLIVLPHRTLEVVEACSGIRSVVSLLALGVAYGCFFEKSWLCRWMLAASAIPIAIVANGLRVAGTGLLTQMINPDFADGFFHLFSGWMVFLFSCVLMYLMHQGMVWARSQLRWVGVA